MRSNTRGNAAPAESAVSLPPDRAFVVQLRVPADGASELFTGRAEHIASGSASRFTSVEELIGFVKRVLSNQEERQR